MTELTYYVAEDGTRFTYKDECEQWESKRKSLPSTFHLFDGCGNELVSNNYLDTIESFDMAHTLLVDNKRGWIEDAEFVKSYWGLLDFVAAPGYYVYIDEEDIYNFYEQCPNSECPVSIGWNTLGKVLEMHDIMGVSEEDIEKAENDYEEF